MRGPILSTLTGLAASASVHASDLQYRHRLDVRSTTDVCANIVNSPLAVTTTPALPPVVLGIINTCLCISGILTFETSNPVAAAAVAYAGQASTTTALTTLINKNAPSGGCVYPDYSTPVCTSGNPCGFTCAAGFTTTTTSCDCVAPNTLCNGVCSTQACPTQEPLQRKREKSWTGSGFCAERGGGWTACGVYGGGARAWECIDTANDLESCGGCALPLTAYSPLGTDCTALTGVADVSCVAGACAVRACNRGYTLAADGTHCMSANEMVKTQASAFGLEHIILGGYALKTE